MTDLSLLLKCEYIAATSEARVHQVGLTLNRTISAHEYPLNVHRSIWRLLPSYDVDYSRSIDNKYPLILCFFVWFCLFPIMCFARNDFTTPYSASPFLFFGVL